MDGLFPNAEQLRNTKIELTIDAITAICIIGSIQLATRHHKFVGPSRKVAEQFARDLQKMVAEKQPATNAVMEMGWNPNMDI